MNVFQYFAANSAQILALTEQHFLFVLICVGVGSAISIALGLVVSTGEPSPLRFSFDWWASGIREGSLLITAAALTVPSLALFVLFLPITGLGTTTAIIVLTIYTLYTVLRNTVAGLTSVDRSILESARGLGYGRLRRLLLIQLPLAWPVILNGIRVTTLISISIAVVASIVQGPGLGKLLLTGITRIGAANAFPQVLIGTFMCLVVAAVFEIFFAIVQRLTIPRGIVSETENMIVLEAVEKLYPGSSSPAVESLDMAVPKGEIVMLIGPSGCGKTTTLKMMNRLIEPTSGRILLDGDDVTDVNGDQLRRKIGYVIQQGGLFPHFSIADNIGVVPKMLGWDKNKVRERVDELLHLVGLEPSTYRDRYPRQLSGGQQQRIGVARALAADPPVMLMDEPFGAIDPITRDRLQDEFLEIQRSVGKTICFVTHDLQEAVKLGDRIAVFGTGGKLHQYSDPDSVLTRPADDFVSDFVGGGAAVRRLSLLELSRLELHPIETDAAAVGNHNGTPVAEVDGSGRPVSWRHLADRDASGTALVTVPLSGTVYDAVDVMLDGSASLVAVVDDEGLAQGVLHWNDLVAGLKTRERER